MTIKLPAPELQVAFSFALGQARSLFLQNVLGTTLENIDIAELDRELSRYVRKSSLKALAKHGLRGELLYPVPCLLRENPYLLGYYRLMLGYSQKEFYKAKYGVSRFKGMEIRGTLTSRNTGAISDLCNALIEQCESLAEGIGFERISKEILDDLSLLTLGTQFRGSANVKKGALATVSVFQAILECVEHADTSSSTGRIEIVNAAGRHVLIEFAPDPDIVIREEMNAGRYRNIIAIEVKGGTDFSNIHNRIGEAEKSHIKAKAAGYVECWTVVNVDSVNIETATKESPSTNRFFILSDLQSQTGDNFLDFRERVISLTGIKSRPEK